MNRLLAAGALLAVAVTACGTPPTATAPAGGHAATALTAAAARDGCVAVRRWSVRRLAAQTVVVPAQETDVSSADTEVGQGAGGVILFGAAAPSDLGTQIAALRRLVPGRLGLLMMTDEEGGGVQRMANLVGNLPWANVMGRYWSAARITRRVAAVATGMAGFHVTMDLAPVVDVDGRNVAPGPSDADGWRSFSGNTSVVVRDGLAYAHGLERGGVIPVLKHFPGLGGASRNTDYGPAHTLPWRTLRRVGLPPFVAGIKDGVPAIMISNAVVPGLTRLPASLSPVAIHDELVQALGFRGLILTDSLSSGAISGAGYSVSRAAVQAVRAGADMIMYTAASAQAAANQFDAIVGRETAAVAHGWLARSRLLEAATAALTARHHLVCG